MMYRRQKKQYVFASLLGAIAVINLLFFFILHRPAYSEYFNLRDSIARMRSEVAARQLSVRRLEKRSTELDRFEQDRHELFMTRFVPRKSGFAQLLPELEMMGQRAGVYNIRKDYLPEMIPQYGLISVRIKIPVQGGYNNVVNFIRKLETSKTFFLINAIDVRSSTESTPAGVTGGIGLLLDLETFFYQ